MRKIFLFCLILFIFCAGKSIAVESQSVILDDIRLQEHISDIGFRLLNANKVEKRMIFVYSKKDKLIKDEPGLSKRQIVIYEKNINFTKNDDEIAAILAREICKTQDSYIGVFRGFLNSAQIMFAPKKYEIFFDKRAVDYMVAADYNPLGLITYINKAYPQKRYDFMARSNLTSKRLATIYEYIYTNYPCFLANNKYISNPAYQNFLLTSQDNRAKFREKIETGAKGTIKYE